MQQWKRSLSLLLVAVVWSVSGQLYDDTSYDPFDPDIDDPIYRRGNDNCPCLTDVTGYIDNVTILDLLEQYNLPLNTSLPNLYNATPSYGDGCFPHDLNQPWCENFVPESCGRDCSLTWCSRRWCLIDPTECKLDNNALLERYHENSNVERRVQTLRHGDQRDVRFVSYATCYESDRYAGELRIQRLIGRTYRIGLVAATSGWTAAFHPRSQHFAQNLSEWFGPTTEFVTKAAEKYNVTLTTNFTPSARLRNNSAEYWGASSNADLCVFAAQLGLVDFCVGSFTITDRRATEVDWLHLQHQDIVMMLRNIAVSNFGADVEGIFLPFHTETWIFILFCVVPVMAFLTVYHEYGVVGSQYPKQEAFIITDPETGRESLRYRDVPMLQYLQRSFYSTLLALFEGSFGQAVVTESGKVHILGINFFLFMFAAIYTANLAAILTSSATAADVGSYSDAVQAGYRFCITRNRLALLESHFQNTQTQNFVVDPSDGLPGFTDTTAATDAEQRVLRQINPILADDEDDDGVPYAEKKYCHAGLALAEELEVEQSMFRHCDLGVVGPTVVPDSIGFPVYSAVSFDVIAWLLQEKNSGVLDDLLSNPPANRCEVEAAQVSSPNDDDDVAIDIQEMSGVWVVCFGMALLGLIHTVIIRPLYLYWKRRHPHHKDVTRIYKYDQHGAYIRCYEEDWDDLSDDEEDAPPNNAKSNFGLERPPSIKDTMVKMTIEEGEDEDGEEAADLGTNKTKNDTPFMKREHPGCLQM